MSKPVWSAPAFAKRIAMSSFKVAVIVEGRVLDRPFYDRIFSKHSMISEAGWQIYLSEEFSVPSSGKLTQGGGKKSALAIHDYYRSRLELNQESSSGRRTMLFMLDRDYDNIRNSRRKSAHIIYTKYADVEAEIFAYGDIRRALSTALSITDSQANGAAMKLGEFIADLADLWKEWIELCCVSYCVDSRCSVRPSKMSFINMDNYGDLDVDAHRKARNDVIKTASTRYSLKRVTHVTKLIDNIYKSGKGETLVKGKWIPGYLEYKLRDHLSGQVVDFRGFSNNISKAQLDTLNYSDAWIGYYHDRLNSLFSMNHED